MKRSFYLLGKIFLVALLALSLFACKKNEQKVADASAPAEKVVKIGIAKVIFHPSLNATEKGIQDELAAQNINAKYDLQNGNADMNTMASIANKYKSENVDVAVGIGTPIAVAIANTLGDTPIVFSAITDPISAHLVETLDHGYKNITGAVDTIPIKEQILEFRKVVPFKRLGFIYTSSEANSVSMAKTTKEVCNELGIEFVPATITNTSEIKQATESLVGRVDAFYVTTDNVLVSGINALTTTAKANKIPVFSGDVPSSMDGGVVLAFGFDYYQLGRATGKIIIDILNGKKPADIPVFILTKPEDYQILVDLDAAKHLKLNLPKEYVDNAKYVFESGALKEKK